MAKVAWRPEARADVDAITRYIRQFDAGAADRIGIRLIDLGESLADFPERGRLAAACSREMVVVPPYVLRYRVEEGRVTILSVRHGRQQPSTR